eukprot:scaffold37443_cov62-Phaeocystis_antarctica.AAC.3
MRSPWEWRWCGWEPLLFRVYSSPLLVGELRPPGHAQDLLPLCVGQARAHKRPPLMAELVVGARERSLLLGRSRRRGSRPRRVWPLGRQPTAAAAAAAAAAALPLQRCRSRGRCHLDRGRWHCHLDVATDVGS